MYRSIVVCLAVVICLTGAALADIPKLINYQGMLTDEGGNPLTDTVSITFRIYNDTTSVAEINKKWEETQSQVEVIDGLYNVTLGRVVYLDLDFSEDYWLDVTVGAEHMPQRLRFTSVGYAYRAERADTAQYAHGGGGGDNDWDAVGDVLFTHDAWGIARDGNILLGDFDYTHVNLGASCTTGANGEDNEFCTVGGGDYNTANGAWATVGGGRYNAAYESYATVGGGYNNWATGNRATVGGGYSHHASGDFATVGGGSDNTAAGDCANVAGGRWNRARGHYATVPGGFDNAANGSYSFAAGRKAQAEHLGTFVWADSSVDADFASTGNNQFLIRASGGVGIGTTNPIRDLHVAGSGFAEIQLEKTNVPTNKWHLSLWQNGLVFVETDVGYRLALENGGNVGIGTTDPARKLDVNGIVRVRSWGSTPTYNVQVNNNGDLCRVSSSKRYKKNIRRLESHPDKVLNLEPVNFEWKTTSGQDIGLIAEEVHEVIPELVGYDKEGRPDAVRYEMVSLYLLELMKDQVRAIEELEMENEELKQRIEALEGR